MGIAFQDGAVHERPGVALVSVAADVFLVGIVLFGQLPLQAGGESAAASAPKAAVHQSLDHVVGSHLRQNLAQGLIAAGSDVFFDGFGVDDAAVAQSDAVLFLIKIRVDQSFDSSGGYRLLVQKPFYHTAFQQMLRHDLRNVLLLYHGVEGGVRIDDHNGTQGTEAVAAGLHNGHLVGKALFSQLFFQFFHNFVASGGGTARSSADQYMRTIHSSFPPYLISAEARVYSSITWPPTRWRSTTSAAFWGFILI